MKLFKSKILLGVICLVVAAAIAFLILPQFYESQSETTYAVKAAEDIPAGTVITSQMLTTEEVGSYGLPDSVVLDKDTVIGSVAAENLYRGEYLSSIRIISEEEYQQQLLDQTKGLESGYCLITLEIPTSSAGIAGILRAGHTVDVHECVTNADQTITVQKALSSMYVYDVLNAELESLTALDEELAEAIVEEDTDYDFKPVYIVFRCTESQAQTLIRLERMEALHLTLQKTGG